MAWAAAVVFFSLGLVDIVARRRIDAAVHRWTEPFRWERKVDLERFILRRPARVAISWFIALYSWVLAATTG